MDTIKVGDVVFVRLDQDVERPMIVSQCGVVVVGSPYATMPLVEFRANGTIFCEPGDHTTLAMRTLASLQDPARIHGHPDRLQPQAYAENLAAGAGIGQWRPR